jgi:hypothetical protein
MSPKAPAAATVTRAQALASRVRAQGLDRGTADPDRLAVVDLGVQDSPAGSAALALAARLPAPSGAGEAGDPIPGRWVLIWSVRGAPHRHRARDLRPLAAALWPADEADAAARSAGAASFMAKNGLEALAGIRASAEALRSVVDRRMTKGEASTLVTRAAPDGVSGWCRACGATHIQDQLMRLAALPAGVRLVPGEQPAVLAPVARWPGPPETQAGAERVVEAYLRVSGPATPADVAAYLGTTTRHVKASWPDGLAEVDVDGRRAWLPEDRLDDLTSDAPARVVRLLPRSDPWLVARDRALTVPDRARHKALWPMIGQPGAVLVDGEVLGTWRTKASGTRLDITVTPFEGLDPGVRRQVEDEAAVVAGVRGHADVRVTYDELAPVQGRGRPRTVAVRGRTRPPAPAGRWRVTRRRRPRAGRCRPGARSPSSGR